MIYGIVSFMKTILFCNLPYAFSIMKPLADALEERGDEYLWYIVPELFNDFPYKQMMHSNSLEYLKDFKADAIFVPGNACTILASWSKSSNFSWTCRRK